MLWEGKVIILRKKISMYGCCSVTPMPTVMSNRLSMNILSSEPSKDQELRSTLEREIVYPNRKMIYIRCDIFADDLFQTILLLNRKPDKMV